MTRRTFLVGLGGGLASAALVVTAWREYSLHTSVIDAAPVPECCTYVDYAGWMLTKSDKDRLSSEDSLRLLDASRVEGHDLADGAVADARACAGWCLSEPDCQGFAYAKPSHPDPESRNRCWLKDTSQLTSVPDPNFSSGLR